MYASVLLLALLSKVVMIACQTLPYLGGVWSLWIIPNTTGLDNMCMLSTTLSGRGSDDICMPNTALSGRGWIISACRSQRYLGGAWIIPVCGYRRRTCSTTDTMSFSSPQGEAKRIHHTLLTSHAEQEGIQALRCFGGPARRSC